MAASRSPLFGTLSFNRIERLVPKSFVRFDNRSQRLVRRAIIASRVPSGVLPDLDRCWVLKAKTH